jgi:dipeptidyl aminopeptidase/acylaminoacyl peptidase
MHYKRMSHHWNRGLTTFVLALAVLLVPAFVLTPTHAQSPAKKVLTVDDYTRWRSISGQEISGDGKWVVYGLSFTNTLPANARPALHILNIENNQDLEVPNASGGTFSPDSRWIAYQVDPSGGRGGRGGRGRATTTPAPSDTPVGAQARGAGAEAPAPPRHVDVRNLSTGTVQSWQDIESFTFSANSSHMILRRRAATPAGAAGAVAGGAGRGGAGGSAAGAEAASTPTGPRGVEVVLLDLSTGRYQVLGSVGDIAFNKAGDLLAYTVDATAKDANGLFVLDLRSGHPIALDNDAKNYNRLTWNEDGTALAVLKGLDVDKMRERDNLLLAYPNLQAALSSDPPGVPITLDPVKAEGFPKGWVVSDRATLSWSDDKKRVFFGMKEQVDAPSTTPRRGTDEVANVDVWNSLDERIQSLQMMRADQDRNFTFRQAFDVSAVKFVKLADETMRDLDVAADGRWAVGRDTRGYISDYKPPAADIYRVNTTTGERKLMLKGQLINNHTFGISTDGHYFLYWKDSKFQAYDLDAGTTKTLAANSQVSFVDTDFDHPGTKPSLGIAGYTSDNKSVLVNHKYDLWQVPLDGSAPRNLTNGIGAKNEIRFRYVRTERLAGGPGGPGGGGGGRGGGGGGQRSTIDLAKPVLLSAYGEWTKKAGFYELAGGQLKELVYDDAYFSNPTKAANADKYLFTRETFAEFPDLRVSGLDFKDIKKISDANPQQAEYMWGHRILFDFKNRDGLRLQGIIGLPDDYKQGEKRPMMVNFYEKDSQSLHRYTAPSYLSGFGSSPIQAISEGYITMLPDIHFRIGASHNDMLECVEAAVRRVIELGYADPKHIGLNGHSYGGEGTALIGCRSKLFAAAADGSGVTDLFFDFNINWGWNYQVMTGNGQNQMQYYLDGQGREGVSPWQDPAMYALESALYHVPEATTPFLIYGGTADSTVSFNNDMAFYNALRFNGKSVILLAYPNEGHSVTGLANRKDLTIRFFQFFDHYLKDAPAPTWMTEGVSYLKKDANRDAPIIK